MKQNAARQTASEVYARIVGNLDVGSVLDFTLAHSQLLVSEPDPGEKQLHKNASSLASRCTIHTTIYRPTKHVKEQKNATNVSYISLYYRVNAVANATSRGDEK